MTLSLPRSVYEFIRQIAAALDGLALPAGRAAAAHNPARQLFDVFIIRL
jgi:hypothetical protein